MPDFERRRAVNERILDLYGGDPFAEVVREAERHRQSHGPECGLFPAGHEHLRGGTRQEIGRLWGGEVGCPLAF